MRSNEVRRLTGAARFGYDRRLETQRHPMSASMVFDPTAPESGEAQLTRQALGGLAGKVVGFIDNAKPNFNYLVEDLSELLVREHGVARVIARRKPGAGTPASAEVMQDIIDQCDAVITGSGD
jgi:uncharacterized protein (DUF2236 family)